MNNNVHGERASNESPVAQFSRNNNPHRVLQPVPIGPDNTSNVFDYGNISLFLTGEVSSANIHRDSLTQRQKHDTSFIETAEEEEDDERFVLDMKKKIDQNCKLRNDENHGIRDLQSRSYLTKKRKCMLSEEDQNLMKRFKRSVNEGKTVTQRSQGIVTTDQDVTITTDSTIPQIIAPIISLNDANSKDGANRIFFRNFVASTARTNNSLITSENARSFVTEAEIEQLTRYEMQCFTPPEKNN